MPTQRPVEIPTGETTLAGDLVLPDAARGLVLFAHGSGSSRRSPRNRLVAADLQAGGFATLLMDLLTDEEEASRDLRFDIALLAGRLVAATDWLVTTAETKSLHIGYFGASTGAAAALVAAATRPQLLGAVVSRGGRPDLAGPSLASVRAPTLLIVGQDDPIVLELNRAALAQLPGEKRLEVVAGASHLFEEAGTLEAAARLARTWFEMHLAPSAHIGAPSGPVSERL